MWCTNYRVRVSDVSGSSLRTVKKCSKDEVSTNCMQREVSVSAVKKAVEMFQRSVTYLLIRHLVAHLPKADYSRLLVWHDVSTDDVDVCNQHPFYTIFRLDSLHSFYLLIYNDYQTHFIFILLFVFNDQLLLWHISGRLLLHVVKKCPVKDSIVSVKSLIAIYSNKIPV